MFPLDPLLEAAFPCPQHYLLASAVFTVHIKRESDTPPPKNVKGTQRTLPAALRGWACPPDANIALPSHLRAPTTPSLKLPAKTCLQKTTLTGTQLSFFFHLAIIDPWINLTGYDTATAQSWGNSASTLSALPPSFLRCPPSSLTNPNWKDLGWFLPSPPPTPPSVSICLALAAGLEWSGWL